MLHLVDEPSLFNVENELCNAPFCFLIIDQLMGVKQSKILPGLHQFVYVDAYHISEWTHTVCLRLAVPSLMQSDQSNLKCHCPTINVRSKICLCTIHISLCIICESLIAVPML